MPSDRHKLNNNFVNFQFDQNVTTQLKQNDMELTIFELNLMYLWVLLHEHERHHNIQHPIPMDIIILAYLILNIKNTLIHTEI